MHGILEIIEARANRSRTRLLGALELLEELRERVHIVAELDDEPLDDAAHAGRDRA